MASNQEVDKALKSSPLKLETITHTPKELVENKASKQDELEYYDKQIQSLQLKQTYIEMYTKNLAQIGAFPIVFLFEITKILVKSSTEIVTIACNSALTLTEGVKTLTIGARNLTTAAAKLYAAASSLLTFVGSNIMTLGMSSVTYGQIGKITDLAENLLHSVSKNPNHDATKIKDLIQTMKIQSKIQDAGKNLLKNGSSNNQDPSPPSQKK